MTIKPMMQRVIGAAVAIVVAGGALAFTQTQAATPQSMAMPASVKQAPAQRPVLKQGDSGETVRWVQKQLGGGLRGTGYFGPKTEARVKQFQREHNIPATGMVAVQTWTAIDQMNQTVTVPIRPAANTTSTSQADPRPQACRYVGKVICVSKAKHNVTMYDGHNVVVSLDARFGDNSSPETTTHNGTFTVLRKYEMWHSTIYNNAEMPYSLFFTNDGEAIHYSATFARQGYNGTSKGCVNTRDMAKQKQLYNAAPIGTRVVVY